MSDQEWLLPDEQRSKDLSQWYTPEPLAKRVIEWANLSPDDVILEPAAGRGALIQPNMGQRWIAYDIDPDNCNVLKEVYTPDTLAVRCADFLSAKMPKTPIDVAIMNPPYENDQDVDFVLKCVKHCGRVIAILRSAFLHGEGRWEKVWQQVRLKRLTILSGRPKFGGEGSARSDFIVVELYRGPRIFRGTQLNVKVEWW
jgi:predicted RNA methylase